MYSLYNFQTIERKRAHLFIKRHSENRKVSGQLAEKRHHRRHLVQIAIRLVFVYCSKFLKIFSFQHCRPIFSLDIPFYFLLFLAIFKYQRIISFYTWLYNIFLVLPRRAQQIFSKISFLGKCKIKSKVKEVFPLIRGEYLMFRKGFEGSSSSYQCKAWSASSNFNFPF